MFIGHTHPADHMMSHYEFLVICHHLCHATWPTFTRGRLCAACPLGYKTVRPLDVAVCGPHPPPPRPRGATGPRSRVQRSRCPDWPSSFAFPSPSHSPGSPLRRACPRLGSSSPCAPSGRREIKSQRFFAETKQKKKLERRR